MNLKEISQRALDVRKKYAELERKKYGREWTSKEIVEGLVGDVGDFMKLAMAKDGIRSVDHLDEKLAHELTDIFWCTLVLSHAYGIDLEHSFMRNMDALEEQIAHED